jgi:hypothetical protein
VSGTSCPLLAGEAAPDGLAELAGLALGRAELEAAALEAAADARAGGDAATLALAGAALEPQPASNGMLQTAAAIAANLSLIGNLLFALDAELGDVA